jgi:hypothetical protein
MFEGITIKVGGEDMVLPPLNWKAAKRFYKDIISGDINDPEKAIDLMPEMLHVALARNYPELTQAELEDTITPGELLAAIPQLLAVSGFIQAQAGEA